MVRCRSTPVTPDGQGGHALKVHIRHYTAIDQAVEPLDLLLELRGRPAFAAAAQAPQPSDPYKATLDRLESLTVAPLAEWRYHEDIAHPEDVSLSDAGWPAMKVGDRWNTGARVLRRWVEVHHAGRGGVPHT